MPKPRSEKFIQQTIKNMSDIIHDDFGVEKNPNVDPDVNFEIMKALSVIKMYYEKSN